MRSLTRTGLALLGLAMAAPSFARAGLDDVCSTCAGQVTPKHKPKVAAKPILRRHVHANQPGTTVCPHCLQMAEMANGKIPPPPTMVVSGPATAGATTMVVQGGAQGGALCEACQSQAAASGATMVVQGSNAPGYAATGGPAPGGTLMAPGYAVVNPDPALAGMQQTGYSQGGAMAGTPAGVPAGARAGMNMGAANPAANAAMPKGDIVAPPRRRRVSVIAHLLDLDGFGRRGEERQRQARAAHARITYDQADPLPTDISARAVYGR